MLNTPSRRHSSGFTLIELIISIVLIGMLAAVGSSMIADSFTTTRMVNADTASGGKARYAMERLAREIREAHTISTMTPSQLVFVNGTTPANTINISYSDTNLTLQYSSPAALSTLASNVTANPNNVPLLTYYTIDGTTPTTSTSDIRFVVINLTVKDPTSGQSTAQRTRVALRNN